jgi:hypothetical protein
VDRNSPKCACCGQSLSYEESERSDTCRECIDWTKADTRYDIHREEKQGD